MHKYFKSALQSRPTKQNVCTWTPYNNCHAPWKKRGFRCFPHTSNMAFDGWLSWKIRGKWESQSLA